MVDLYDLIANIQKRPAMYLGQPSITHLRTFLSGYLFARRQFDTPQTEQEKQFSNFQTWIQQKFNITSNQSWDKIILFFSQDEQTALKQFFELFNEFASQHQNGASPILAEAVHSSTEPIEA
jgi:hypothetical protein